LPCCAFSAHGEDACEAAVTRAYWPARMQRLRRGPLVELAGDAELWLDGGHNPAAGAVIADTLRRMPARPTHLICGMLRTKDPEGFLRHLRPVAESLTSIAIPGETATLPAEDTSKAGETAGFERACRRKSGRGDPRDRGRATAPRGS
jgi:dihydrofolate synthase / folylpolyglutamate synthase